MAGKTGTAHVADGNIKYHDMVYQASFVGFFPSEKPKYTMAVVIQNTRESKFIYGADVSGRVFKEIADHIYKRFLNDPTKEIVATPDSSWISTLGLKNDLASIFNFLNINYRDSATAGDWRRMDLQQRQAVMKVDSLLVNQPFITPNVKGMGLKDAIYLLENEGFYVTVSGQGKVATQSYPPGKPYSKGQKILLMLN